MTANDAGLSTKGEKGRRRRWYRSIGWLMAVATAIVLRAWLAADAGALLPGGALSPGWREVTAAVESRLAEPGDVGVQPERDSARSGQGAPGEAASGRLDLNTADAAELQTLPGIGEARAQAILELRQELGRFNSADELQRVKGIGPVILERLKPLVTAGPGSS